MIDRATLDRELASVRTQQQQFVRATEQAAGAEKALLALLALLDKQAAEKAADQENSQ